MRKTIRFLILVLLCTSAPVVFGQIQTVQYWFDTNFAGRQTQNTTANSIVRLSELNAENLSEGIHQMHIRAKDNNSWSVVHSRMFYKLAANAAEMAAYEYWVNNDFSNRKSGTLSGSSALIEELDVSSYSEGIHVLHIRTKDKLGRYSVVHSQLFYKYSKAKNIQLKSFEYWIDNDFVNKKTAVLSGNTATLTDLNVESYPEGIHIIHIRAIDAIDRHSVVHSQMFYKLAGEDINQIDSYRYWYDNAFELHRSIILETPINPYELKTSWTLPEEFETGEKHTFHIQFRDLAGRWSVVSVDSFQIALPVAVDSIRLNKTATTLLEGKSETLSHIIHPVNASNQNVVWSSSNENVATVENGVIYAVNAGTAVITVTTEDGDKMASCAITVEELVIPVVSVSLNKPAINLLIGASEMLTGTVTPAGATNQNMSWSSSDETVATVENGVVHAVNIGEAVIAVTTEDGDKTASCTVTVLPIRVESIILNKTKIELLAGESELLTYTFTPANATNRNVVWSSSNETVARVENGIVDALNVGEAVITVTTEDGGKAVSCTVRVLPVAVESIRLNKTATGLIVGDRETLTYTLSPTNATNTNVIWSSSNESVATVENGVVHALNIGEATITVTTEDGNKTASCTITVEKLIIPVASVSLNKPAISLLIGDSETLTCMVTPTEASNQNVVWSSSDESIARVENGIVDAVGIGRAVITVTTIDGNKTANCAVAVLPIEVESIALNKTKTELLAGESELLTYTLTPANASNQNVIWNSSNENIAGVENGVITALAAGTAIITVTAEDKNLFDQCEVTVIQSIQYNVEYFFDTDPGFGKAIGIPDTLVQLISETSDEKLEQTGFNASVEGLNDGLHTLYVRAKNNKGWSQTQNRLFAKASLPNEPGLTIKHIEYFIDSDPGYGQGDSISLSENNGIYTFHVDTRILADGFHTLYVRAQNTEGNWSPVMNRTFIKMDIQTQIKAAEYYIDLDPGEGEGIEIPTVGTDIRFTVDLNNMEAGEHTLSIRLLNQFDQWETIGNHAFTLLDPDGIENIGADNLAVYPNPVADILFIKNEHFSIKSVEITDIRGVRVHVQDTPENNIITIPISLYAPATYILNIYTNSGNVHTFKIIKK